MSVRSATWLFVVLVLLAAAPVAAQRSSSCADCHYTNAPGRDVNPFMHGHVSDWQASVHGRKGVGCERCHGGDATKYNAFLAHLDVRRASDPTSPANRTNLAGTCGTCHAGPYAEFQKSHHYSELKAGNPNVPTCVTCHGPVAGEVPSAKMLESQCAVCHGEGTTVARNLYPIAGRVFLEEVRRVRVDLDAARKAIDRVKNPERRGELAQQWQQAEVPLIQAIHAGHQFKLTDADERLSVARARIGRVLEVLQQSGQR
jgi:hypothetical protein